MAEPDKRLGGGPEGGKELMKHPWFDGVDWDAIMAKKIKPPFKPKLASEIDVRHIDSTFTEKLPTETPESLASGSLMGGGQWEGFTYEAPKMI